MLGAHNLGGGAIGDGILGGLLDPMNMTGLFGKNQGPGAFMNPNGQGGALYPGGPGLPGGNAMGVALNDAVGAFVGAEALGAGGSGAAAGSGFMPVTPQQRPAVNQALAGNPALTGVAPSMVTGMSPKVPTWGDNMFAGGLKYGMIGQQMGGTFGAMAGSLAGAMMGYF